MLANSGWAMTPANYRRHTRECREIAEKMMNEKRRTMLLEMAVK
jgi:hypothetical protein